MCGQYWSFQWTWHTTNPAQNQSGTWLNQHTTYPLHDRSGTRPIWHLTNLATNQSGTWVIRDTTYPPHYRSCTQPIWHLNHSATNLHTPDLVIDWSGARQIWCTTNLTHTRLKTHLAHDQSCTQRIHCIWHTTNLLLFSFVFMKILRSNCLRSMYWNYTILATLSSTTY